MKLSIVEIFLLLAHHPSKGRFIIAPMQINYGIIGAILLEMSLEDKIGIDNDILTLKNNEATDNQIVSEIRVIISSSKKTRKIKYWIAKLVRKSSKYMWAILSELANKNFISIEYKKFLGFIPYKKTYLIDNKTREILIEQLKNNMLLNQELSNESVIMLGLIEACKMHSIFTQDKKELKIIKAKLKQVIKESPIANSLDQTIKQVQAAILGAVIGASVAASASGSH